MRLRLIFQFTYVQYCVYIDTLKKLYRISIQSMSDPADKASNNVIIIWRLHYIDVLKQEIMNTKFIQIRGMLQSVNN